MKKTMLYLLIAGFVLSGCATPHVVDEKQLSDEELSCAQLLDEIAEAKDFEEDARDEKGVTGTNTAAVLFFWPALFATYANVEEAIDAAEERQKHLKKIYKNKDCQS